MEFAVKKDCSNLRGSAGVKANRALISGRFVACESITINLYWTAMNACTLSIEFSPRPYTPDIQLVTWDATRAADSHVEDAPAMPLGELVRACQAQRVRR